jgi:hypothetical protein
VEKRLEELMRELEELRREIRRGRAPSELGSPDNVKPETVRPSLGR